MNTLRRLAYGGILWVFACGFCWGHELARPIPVTMCELFEHPERYAGRMIEVRAASVSAELSISDAIFTGPVEACSAWLDIVVRFPWQVTPPPDFDLVRDASLAKIEDAINTGKTRIDATYEGRFDILHVVRNGKRINVATGKEERKRIGKKGWYDARIVLRQVSDVDAMWLPRL